MRERSHIVIISVISIVALLGVFGACGWFAFIKPALGTCNDSWPKSISDPPVMPSAEQVEFGKSSYEPQGGNIGKLAQFQTTDRPFAVYTYYSKTLGQDGWREDPRQQVLRTPDLAEAKFNWECTTLENTQQPASLWLHAEVIPTGKTMVTLNYDYVPH